MNNYLKNPLRLTNLILAGSVRSVALFLLLIAVGTPSVFAQTKSSKALRLTVPEFVDGKQELVVTLLYRDGEFHNAWATAPTRDNLMHRVNPTPANPFRYEYKDGRKIPYDITTKNMTGTPKQADGKPISEAKHDWPL